MSTYSWLLEALNTLPVKEGVKEDILKQATVDSTTTEWSPCIKTFSSNVPEIQPVSCQGQENKTLQNWARIESCRPKQYFEPESMEDIEEIVKQCRVNNWKLRVFGTGE